MLVYMTADNNLEAAGVGDLLEMADVGSGTNFNIIVQVDRIPGESDAAALNLGDFTSTKRVKVESGSLTQLQDLGEVNMGDAGQLTAFLTWGIQNYPADRYAVVLWDHGGAWMGFGWDDTNNNDHLSLPDIKQSLQDALQATGVPQYGIIGFDACLMATVETVKTVASLGEYLVSSEETEPGHGWDYRRLSAVKNTPSMSPRDVSHEILAGFVDQAQEANTAPSITLSVVDLTAASAILGAMDTLTGVMDADNVAKAPSIGRHLAQARGFGGADDPAQDFHMVDVGDLAKQLASDDTGFTDALGSINSALQGTVVENHCGPARDGCTGLAIYFPPQSQYYRSDYAQIPGMDGWRTFLTHYFSAATAVGSDPSQVPTFTNADHVAETSTDGDSLVFTGTLANGASPLIAKAYGNYGVMSESTIFVLGSQAVGYNETAAALYWDKTVLVATQGETSMYAYIDFEPADNNMTSATIPFMYTPPNSTEQRYVVLIYIFDSSGTTLQSTYYDLSGGSAAELAPEAGSHLQPIILSADANGSQWVFSSTTPLDPTAEFTFSWVTPQAGTTIYADVNVENFAGKGDYVYATGAL